MKKGSTNWVVRYSRTPNGHCHWYAETYFYNRRDQKWFRTEEAATTFANHQNHEMVEWGQQALSAEERAMASLCIGHLTPWGKTLFDATDFYLTHLSRMQHHMTVAALGERAQTEFSRRLKNGEIGDRHFGSIKQLIKKLTTKFGNLPITAVKTFDLRNWIAGMDVAPASKNWARLYSSVVFGYAKDAGLLDTNPAAEIPAFRNRIHKKPVILKVEQLQRLLEVAEPEIVPALAIGAFAGLRASEIERLDWREIRLFENPPTIEVQVLETWTAQRRFVNVTSNLFHWLKFHWRKEGPVFPPTPKGRGHRTDKPGGRVYFERAVAAAGLNPWPRNALRRSFCSYHLVMFENSGTTAMQAGHTSPDTTFAYYRTLLTKAEATQYFGILPKPGYEQAILNARRISGHARPVL